MPYTFDPFRKKSDGGTLVLLLLYIDKRVVNHDYILSLNSLDSPLVVEFIADFTPLLC